MILKALYLRLLIISLSVPSLLFSGLAPNPVTKAAPAITIASATATVIATIPVATTQSTSIAGATLHRRGSAPNIYVGLKTGLEQQKTSSAPVVIQSNSIQIKPPRPSRSQSVTERGRELSTSSPSPSTYSYSMSVSPPAVSPTLRPVATTPLSPLNLGLPASDTPKETDRKTYNLLMSHLLDLISTKRIVAPANKVCEEIMCMQKKSSFLTPQEAALIKTLSDSLKAAEKCIGDLKASRKAKAEAE